MTKKKTAKKKTTKPVPLSRERMRCLAHDEGLVRCRNHSRGPRFFFLCTSHFPKSGRPNVRLLNQWRKMIGRTPHAIGATR